MIRKITENDKDEFISMSELMYSSSAVSHDIPPEYHLNTFKELMKCDTYAEAYIFEYDGDTAGYALLAKTFSHEAGGIVIWIEELFVKEQFRNKGFGSEFLKFLESNKSDQVARLRL